MGFKVLDPGIFSWGNVNLGASAEGAREGLAASALTHTQVCRACDMLPGFLYVYLWVLWYVLFQMYIVYSCVHAAEGVNFKQTPWVLWIGNVTVTTTKAKTRVS